MCIHFLTCRTSTLEDATFHRMEWCKFLWGNPCTAVEPLSHLGFCLWGLRVLDAFLTLCRMKELGEGFGCVDFARLLILCRKLQLSPFEHCPSTLHCQKNSWTSLFRLWPLESREPQTTARMHLGRTTFPSRIRVIGFSPPRSSRVLSDGTHPLPARYLFSTNDHGWKNIDSKNWIWLKRLNLFWNKMTQRIVFFFLKNDWKNCPSFFSVWIKELNPLFEHVSMNWTLF